MTTQNSNLEIGAATLLEVEKVYSINVSVRGLNYSLIVVRHTASNGIMCLAGHDILRSAEPDFNFYPFVIEAVKKCDEDSN